MRKTEKYSMPYRKIQKKSLIFKGLVTVRQFG